MDIYRESMCHNVVGQCHVTFPTKCHTSGFGDVPVDFICIKF